MTHVAEIYKEFTFEAAHRLPRLPATHKCWRLHGHSFRIGIGVEGAVDDDLGWVIDFGAFKGFFKPLEEALDHRYLNEIAGLENPTSENLAIWIWERLSSALPDLIYVRVHETCTSGCIYRGRNVV